MSTLLQLLQLLRAFDSATIKAVIPLLTKLFGLLKSKTGTLADYVAIIMEIFAVFVPPGPTPVPTPPPGPVVFAAASASDESNAVGELVAAGVDKAEAEAFVDSLK